MIATVDKLDLSIEPDSDVGRDEYDEDFDTDTLSDTQVKVSSYLVFHPNCSGDNIAKSKLCCYHPTSPGSAAESLQGERPHSYGQFGHLGLPCSTSSPRRLGHLGAFSLAISWCLGSSPPPSVRLVQAGQDACEGSERIGQRFKVVISNIPF